MRYLIVALSMLLGTAIPAHAEINVSIGINVGAYPSLVRVPGYPVYYDPRASSNYFFYDGLYWVYQGDNWYQSSWYNGPWQTVGYYDVPDFVLRVPVRYYRQPPSYFRGWRADAAPRWGEHWGPAWQSRRNNWDNWDHRAAPRAAPLPSYQRQYSGERYPRETDLQRSIRSGQYKYQPRDTVTQQHWQGNPPASRNEPERQGPPPGAQNRDGDRNRDDRSAPQDKRRDDNRH